MCFNNEYHAQGLNTMGMLWSIEFLLPYIADQKSLIGDVPVYGKF